MLWELNEMIQGVRYKQQINPWMCQFLLVRVCVCLCGITVCMKRVNSHHNCIKLSYFFHLFLSTVRSIRTVLITIRSFFIWMLIFTKYKYTSITSPLKWIRNEYKSTFSIEIQYNERGNPSILFVDDFWSLSSLKSGSNAESKIHFNVERGW